VAAQQAGLAELTEDVDQESCRQIVSCGELVAGDWATGLVAVELGDRGHQPHPIVDLVGDPHGRTVTTIASSR
jgi:hypothetical protein